jgi:hypothetical protein
MTSIAPSLADGPTERVDRSQPDAKDVGKPPKP